MTRHTPSPLEIIVQMGCDVKNATVATGRELSKIPGELRRDIEKVCSLDGTRNLVSFTLGGVRGAFYGLLFPTRIATGFRQGAEFDENSYDFAPVPELAFYGSVVGWVVGTGTTIHFLYESLVTAVRQESELSGYAIGVCAVTNAASILYEWARSARSRLTQSQPPGDSPATNADPDVLGMSRGE